MYWQMEINPFPSNTTQGIQTPFGVVGSRFPVSINGSTRSAPSQRGYPGLEHHCHLGDLGPRKPLRELVGGGPAREVFKKGCQQVLRFPTIPRLFRACPSGSPLRHSPSRSRLVPIVMALGRKLPRAHACILAPPAVQPTSVTLAGPAGTRSGARRTIAPCSSPCRNTLNPKAGLC